MDIKLHKQYQNIQESHWLFRVRDTILEDIAKKYFKAGSSVFDFGCNYGHSVRLLRKLGYDARGFDVSEEAIQYGNTIGITHISSKLEEFPEQSNFDAAISLDVLEHIKDDAKALMTISSRVKSGGIIVIVVPTYMFLWGVQDEVAHHFRRYTMSELVHLSKQVGEFEIVRKSYFNTLLFVPIALFRLAARFLGKGSRDSDFDVNNAVLDWIFFAIFNFERKILRYINFPFGVSALLILKKK